MAIWRQQISFKKLYRLFLYTVAIFVVTSAVMLSVARLVFPEVKGYREHIEQVLGDYLEYSVKISAMDARLIGLTPTLIFKDVRMYEGEQGKEIISFKEAHLGIAAFTSIVRRTLVPSDFAIVGTVISVTKSEKGKYVVQGLDITNLDANNIDSSASSNLTDWLFTRSNISLRESTIILNKVVDKKTWRLTDVDVSFRNDNNRHQLTGDITLPEEIGHSLELAVDFNGELYSPETWQGVFYFNGKSIQFANTGLLPEVEKIRMLSGVADYKIWGEWDKNEVKDISGDISLYNIVLGKKSDKNTLNIDVINTLLSWSKSPEGWSLNLEDFQYIVNGNVRPLSNIYAKWQDVNESSDIDVAISYCRVDDLNGLLSFTDVLGKNIQNRIKHHQPSGIINNLRVSAAYIGEQIERYTIAGYVDKVGVKPWKSVPGFSGISGQFRLSETSGVLNIDSPFFVLTAPKLFRNEIYVDRLKTSLNLINMPGMWEIYADGMIVENSDIKTETDFLVTIPKDVGEPHLDLQVEVYTANAVNASYYQPVGIMNKGLISWVDHAFASGRVSKAGVLYNGQITSPPYRSNEASIQAVVEAENMAIDYHLDWPRVHSAKLAATVTDKGIHVQSNAAKLYDSNISELDIKINNFLYPVLQVSGKVYGSLDDNARFMVESPIAPSSSQFVAKTRFGGNVATKMKFRLPLSDHVEKKYPLAYSGKTELLDAAMFMSDDTIDVVGINGTVHISDEKMSSNNIVALVMGGLAKAKLTTTKPNDNFIIKVHASGKNTGAKLYKKFGVLGGQRVQGRIAWDSILTLAHELEGKRMPTTLTMKSNLSGVAVDLPEPFYKSANASRNFEMSVKYTSDTKMEMATQYGDRVSTNIEFNSTYTPMRILRGGLHLAAGRVELPEKNEFHITGVLNDLSQNEWDEVISEHLAIHKKKNNDPILFIPAIFDMGYMNIQKQESSKEEKNNRKKWTDPRILPEMRGRIRKFVVHGSELGDYRFAFRKMKKGLIIDSISLESEYMNFQGSGQWRYQRGRHQTALKATMKTPNLGKMLTGLGYKAIIEKGEGQSVFDLNWKAPPYVFSFESLSGNMNVNVEDGAITEVDPGAGRLLGLLSLSALPRRLILDFSDMSKGMHFDDLKGSFKIHNGDAVSENMEIKGTVADVKIVGRTGLHKKDFDQIVTVTPQASGTFPIFGGLLGGTQIGAIILVFERLFGSDMDKSFSRQYRVTGTWDKPVIERLDKDVDDDAGEDDTAFIANYDKAA